MSQSEEPYNLPDEIAAHSDSVEDVIREDGRYAIEAYGFLHEALGRAVQHVHGRSGGESTHVSGQQLCYSLRDLARERWGLMAPAVLRHWGIRGSGDFGNMVYLLIRHGFMRKTDEDSIDDFREVFDLERDFDISDEIRLCS
jgi:uncharacterized repeat protein (TIGR04138 family)